MGSRKTYCSRTSFEKSCNLWGKSIKWRTIFLASRRMYIVLKSTSVCTNPDLRIMWPSSKKRWILTFSWPGCATYLCPEFLGKPLILFFWFTETLCVLIPVTKNRLKKIKITFTNFARRKSLKLSKKTSSTLWRMLLAISKRLLKYIRS